MISLHDLSTLSTAVDSQKSGGSALSEIARAQATSRTLPETAGQERQRNKITSRRSVGNVKSHFTSRPPKQAVGDSTMTRANAVMAFELSTDCRLDSVDWVSHPEGYGLFKVVCSPAC